jgi:hypothetical protein
MSDALHAPARQAGLAVAPVVDGFIVVASLSVLRAVSSPDPPRTRGCGVAHGAPTPVDRLVTALPLSRSSSPSTF